MARFPFASTFAAYANSRYCLLVHRKKAMLRSTKSSHFLITEENYKLQTQ